MRGESNEAFEENEKPEVRVGHDSFEIIEDGSKVNKHIEDNNNSDKYTNKIVNYIKSNESTINRLLIVILNVAVGGYFSYATYNYIDTKNNYIPPKEADEFQLGCNETCKGYCGIQWCDGYGMLLLLLLFIYIGLIYFLVVKPKWGKAIQHSVFNPISYRISKILAFRFAKIGFICAIVAVFVIFIVLDTIDSRDRLRSLIGMVVLFAFGYIFSKSRSKVKIRPVLCGFALQFLLGVFCIRWEVGRSIFKCLGDKMAGFLNFSKIGSKFVYGKLLVYEEDVFAFSILPVIFFFSFIISMLYYWGAMQWIVQKLGWILQVLIGTTVCESVTCAANIFLGMTESPLLIGPYIKYLTHSEIHTIMASGFATVSGTVLAAYISFGAEPAHLITSSVMAAPAALSFAKLFYPETEESKTTADNITIEKTTDSSVLDAASNGAVKGIMLVLGIIANIVAFVSFISFLNSIVNWLGILVGIDYLTFEWLFAKLFIPLAWIIGIPWEDSENVAKLIATKTIINEFVAYEKLGEMKVAKEISLRSSAIATYAICGFANPSSLGIMIGGLSAVCPEKRPTITAVAIRAFIAGCIICFMTASIAGLLMTEDIFNSPSNCTDMFNTN